MTKKVAEKILNKIRTAEDAIALKGVEREKYLKALDKVYGPAVQRAKDMGFGPEIWYHGTPKWFDKFDQTEVKKWFGDKIEEPHGGWEAFVTNDKIAAKKFGGRFSDEKNAIIRQLRLRGETKNPYIALKNNNLLDNYDPKNTWKTVETPEAKKAINKSGIDNAIITEEGFANTQKADSKNVAVGSASNLRDINAAFDPRFKDSPLLMSATSRGNTKLTNPANLVAKAYEKYSKGASGVAKQISDKIYKQTSGQFLPNEVQENDPVKALLEMGVETAIDPLNYIGPGQVNAIAKTAKSSNAVKKILKKILGK